MMEEEKRKRQKAAMGREELKKRFWESGKKKK